MNTQAKMQRAFLLLQQERHDQAAETLSQVLAEDPNVAAAHALLSMCWSRNRDRWHDATREAEMAIHLAPDESLSHYAMAVILQKRNHLPDALSAANEAIRLDSSSAQNYSLAAMILAQQERWPEALEVASQGMAVDPDHEGCASVRSLSLERLGRTTDAATEADAAVKRNPDSAQAHAMRGWTQLQNGDYESAQNSFREALRLDPTDEFARSGMIEALNNNHLLFRIVFRFYSFIGRMGKNAQWAIILGLFFGMRLLPGFARANPGLEPYVLPISMLYLGFCLLTWIANPLFNTFLRFHPLGKFLLSEKQKWASNTIAICLGIGVAGAIFKIVQGRYDDAIIMFIAPVFLTLPLSLPFELDGGWPWLVSVAAAVVLTLLCLASIAMLAIGGPWGAIFSLYTVGVLLFSFAGNLLRNVNVKHV